MLNFVEKTYRSARNSLKKRIRNEKISAWDLNLYPYNCISLKKTCKRSVYDSILIFLYYIGTKNVFASFFYPTPLLHPLVLLILGKVSTPSPLPPIIPNSPIIWYSRVILHLKGWAELLSQNSLKYIGFNLSLTLET